MPASLRSDLAVASTAVPLHRGLAVAPLEDARPLAGLSTRGGRFFELNFLLEGA